MIKQHLYFLGLDQPIMAGLAVATKQLGFAVSGSADQLPPPLDEQLNQAGIHSYSRYQSQHINPDSLIVVGPQIAKQNPELRTAQKLKLEVVSVAQLIQQLAAKQQQVVVIGSPLTAALVASSLQSTKNSADIISHQVLATTNHWSHPSAVHYAAKKTLVIDTDWQPASCLDAAAEWLYLSPSIVILAHEPSRKLSSTYYKDLLHLLKHMADSQSASTVQVILHDQDKQSLRLVKQVNLKYSTYGQTSAADWRATKIKYTTQNSTFGADFQAKPLELLTSQFIGQQGVAAVMATLACAHALEVDMSQALTEIGNSNGLLTWDTLQATVQDIHIIESILPWSSDLELHINRVRQQFLLPKTDARLWLLISQDEYSHLSPSVIKKALNETDIIIRIDTPDTSRSSSVASPPQPIHYSIPVDELPRFIAKHVSPNDLIYYIHAKNRLPIVGDIQAAIQAQKRSAKP